MTTTPEQLRFAVLYHDGIPEPHFDLLIETVSAPEALLATWRCPCWPLVEPTTVERQPDHRRLYLDYEGPVSGGRGRVRRIASGFCRILEASPTVLRIALLSPAGTRTIHLALIQASCWQASPAPAPTSA